MRPNKCGLNELIKRSNTIKIVNGGGKSNVRFCSKIQNLIFKQTLRNTLCACTTLSEYYSGDYGSL